MHHRMSESALFEGSESRIPDKANSPIPLQKFRYHLSRLNLLTETDSERREAINEDGPCAFGGKNPSEVLSVHQQTVVTPARPHNDPSHIRTESTDSFGQRLYHKVDTRFHGTLTIRRGKGIIHGRVEVMILMAVLIVFPGNADDLLHVDQFHGWVHRSLEIEHPCGGSDRVIECDRVVKIDPLNVNPVARHPVLQQRKGATVEHFVRDDLMAAPQQDPAESCNRSHAGGKRHGAIAPLGDGEVLFEKIFVGFAQPVVNIDGRTGLDRDIVHMVSKLHEPLGPPFGGGEAEHRRGRKRGNNMMTVIPRRCKSSAPDHLCFRRVIGRRGFMVF